MSEVKVSVLPTVIYPDPVLEKVAREVKTVDSTTRKIVDDMFDTMYYKSGIGLAAPQVGISARMLVMYICDDNPTLQNKGSIAINNNTSSEYIELDEAYCMINPVITYKSAETSVRQEGCISLPGIYYDVERHTEIEVEYLDYQGNKVKKKAVGLQSVCVQHEIDHLDGIVFIKHSKYISRMKHDMAVRKLQKLKRNLKLQNNLKI